MAGFSDYTELALLNHLFGDPAFTAPTNVFVALSTTAPADDGTNVTEPAAGAYARVSTAAADWDAATGTAPVSKSNGSVITFPAATASWGTITHFALYDASTGGNMLASGALTTSKLVDNGDTASFAAGALTLELGDPGDVYS